MEIITKKLKITLQAELIAVSEEDIRGMEQSIKDSFKSLSVTGVNNTAETKVLDVVVEEVE